MKVAIIPARGGSKRIPRKNIRHFCGKPILAYSIEAAIQSNVFDRVIVTTDDEEIAEIACAHKAEVPFKRPAELSDDHTPTIPVIAHAITEVEKESTVDFACCIYATAPFVQCKDIVTGIESMNRCNGSQFAFPVTTFSFPIMRALRIEDNRINMLWPEHERTRSQDLTDTWHDAGQFYWGTAEAWKTAKGVYSSVCLPIQIPRWRVQDIDTPEDWDRAERLYAALREEILN
ncbi:MAG: pseudaminic acid cytidylyltransferase [bacterium]|nr:pseudaminic acid cytidylyltransferase [bacterium]